MSFPSVGQIGSPYHIWLVSDNRTFLSLGFSLFSPSTAILWSVSSGTLHKAMYMAV